ncbi:MAG TPA: 3-oxoacyl-ACP reductase FabG [Acidimicrobiia bacterium]|nr:3-oxoacyl-ACP reductase FabG [Acidimicrobiia bacterium]
MSESAGSARSILVTGASRGIGAAIARAAAQAGFDVAIGYLEQRAEAEGVAEELRASGRRAVAIEADVATRDGARHVVSAAQDAFGGLYGLVNNAGIMPETPFLDIDPDEWDRVIATDLSAAFHTCQSAIPGMVDQGGGVIVNISSRLGQIGWPGVVHYSAAKAGLLGLTKSLAREFGPRGVRVNAVAPGATLTAMAADVTVGEAGERRLAEIPARRFAQPEDVAAAVVFLLSDQSAMFHGQTLCPNGGGFMP